MPYVFSLKMPGSRIQCENNRDAFEQYSMLQSVLWQFDNAAISLFLFEQHRPNYTELPRSYSFNIPFIYARSFLFSLDNIFSIFSKFSDMKVPDTVKKAINELQSKFPVVREVRNSSHHIEDRIRGIGKYENP